MKKLLSLVLAALMLLSFAACSGNGGQTANGTQEPTEAPTPEPTPEVHQITDEEIFAARVLIKGAHMFNEPLSVKVKNVWIYHPYSTLDAFKLTYEIEVKNSAGIMESVYYGSKYTIDDLSEESLKKVTADIGSSIALTILGSSLGDSYYFKKNEIEAMQNGVLLDTALIQEYFLKNYK